MDFPPQIDVLADRAVGDIQTIRRLWPYLANPDFADVGLQAPALHGIGGSSGPADPTGQAAVSHAERRRKEEQALRDAKACLERLEHVRAELQKFAPAEAPVACLICGPTEERLRLGLCSAHYQQWRSARRTGETKHRFIARKLATAPK